MRLFDKLCKDILLSEVNIVNKNDLIIDINAYYASQFADKNIKNWFLTNFINWFNKQESQDSIQQYNPKPSDPEWMSSAYEYTGIDNDLKQKLDHIVDFFNSLDNTSNLKYQTFEQVLQKSEEWTTKINKKIPNTEGEIKTVFKFPDGFKIVELIDKKSYEREGKLMGHCLGSYEPTKKTGGKKQLSLRDPKNNPHVTMEIIENRVTQIKGKENKKPISKYHHYIKQFIYNSGLIVTKDGESIGYIFYGNQYFDPESEEWQQVFQKYILPVLNDMTDRIKERIHNNIIEGDVYISGNFFTKIPDIFQGVTINGDFRCNGNRLTTLQGCPKIVTGDFNCHSNILTTLQGCPETVSGSFICDNNRLTTLQGSPETVGRDFYCNNNQLTTLQGSPKTVGGNFFCKGNRLTTLQGSPETVSVNFICSDNRLTTLQGSPKIIGGIFNCSYNELTTLQGIGKVKGDFFCNNNKHRKIPIDIGTGEVQGHITVNYVEHIKNQFGELQHVIPKLESFEMFVNKYK